MESLTRIAVVLGLGLVALGASAGEIRHSTINPPLWASGTDIDSDSRALLRIGIVTGDRKMVEPTVTAPRASHNADETGTARRQSIGTTNRGPVLGRPSLDANRAASEAFGSPSLAGRESVKAVTGRSSLRDASASMNFAPNSPAGTGFRAVQKIEVRD